MLNRKKVLFLICFISILTVSAALQYAMLYHRDMMNGIRNDEIAQVKGTFDRRSYEQGFENQNSNEDSVKQNFKAELGIQKEGENQSVIFLKVPYSSELIGFEFYWELDSGIDIKSVQGLNGFDCNLNKKDTNSVHCLVASDKFTVFNRGENDILRVYYDEKSNGNIVINGSQQKSTVSLRDSEENFLSEERFILNIDASQKEYVFEI